MCLNEDEKDKKKREGRSVLYEKERTLIVEMGKKLLASGLVEGTGGNCSICVDPGKTFLISPSGMDYNTISPEDVVLLGWNGNVLEGERTPSSEWELHREAYNVRVEARGVVHTHSAYAAAFSCLGKDLPPVHYLIGYAGTSVPWTPYALFGSPELARNAAPGLKKSRAVLLAHHGVLAVGESLEKAYVTAEAVEYVAKIYCHACVMGEPAVLSEEDMARALRRFDNYGQMPGK